MIRKASKWFMGLSKLGKTGLVIASIVGLSALGSATNSNQQQANLNFSAKSSSAVKSDSTTRDIITHQTVTTTETVPFTSTSVNTSSLNKGDTQTQTAGVNGVRTHTFDVTYTNGVETSRVETSNVITTQPENEVIYVGTYVPPEPGCPNGSYVNTYGNTVCSPYQSQEAPAGATAKCIDGTYSFSQTRRGTCSHHGGVASWL